MKPHRSTPRRHPAPRLAALGIAISLALPCAAASDDELDADAIEPAWTRRLVADLRDEKRPPRWLGENLHFKKGVGLEYRSDWKLGDRELEVGLQGPVVRKNKRLGLTFEVRF